MLRTAERPWEFPVLTPGSLQAVVFDFDGTLAELTIDFGAMKRELLALVQVVIPTARLVPGIPALEWMEIILSPLLREAPEEALALRARFDRRIMDIEIAAARKGELFPFVRPMLHRLRGDGLKLAVITRNCTQAVREVFPDIAEYTDCVFARGDVSRVKPDPGHLHVALQHMDVEACRAIMVGDHVLDIATGKGAGTWTAGVLTGVCTRQNFVDAGADIVADDGAGAVWAFLELHKFGRLI
ncbi:HAD family hydrolase [Desulfovibrio ferrophilus]|nr:HAD family hydrolase [Desulfovibrio ferrophilus]